MGNHPRAKHQRTRPTPGGRRHLPLGHQKCRRKNHNGLPKKATGRPGQGFTCHQHTHRKGKLQPLHQERGNRATTRRTNTAMAANAIRTGGGTKPTNRTTATLIH
nr:MAG TPA: hypothetical protein [Caudoviricetes sp.]